MLLSLLLQLQLASAGDGAASAAAASARGEPVTCLAGIEGGRLAAGAAVTRGHCAGHAAADSSFVCGGVNNWLEWRSAAVFLGAADFTVSASLMLETVNGTAASVVLLSAGGREDIVNLDCT